MIWYQEFILWYVRKCTHYGTYKNHGQTRSEMLVLAYENVQLFLKTFRNGGVSLANIAYIRVSAQDQNTGRQHQCFDNAHINLDKIFEEKVSGKNITDRPQLKEMMAYLREGDVLYIESISRLARSTSDFLNMMKALSAKKVSVVSIKENFNTSTPQGKFALTMFATLYELERDSIKERQREGINLCLAENRPYGRPRVKLSNTFPTNYKRWKSGKITAVEFMKLEGLAKTTFYKMVKNFEKANLDRQILA